MWVYLSTGGSYFCATAVDTGGSQFCVSAWGLRAIISAYIGSGWSVCIVSIPCLITMVSKKGKGAKGKQPAPKKAKPALPEPATPGSSGDELDDPVNMEIVQHLEALVRNGAGGCFACGRGGYWWDTFAK